MQNFDDEIDLVRKIEQKATQDKMEQNNTELELIREKECLDNDSSKHEKQAQEIKKTIFQTFDRSKQFREQVKENPQEVEEDSASKEALMAEAQEAQRHQHEQLLRTAKVATFVKTVGLIKSNIIKDLPRGVDGNIDPQLIPKTVDITFQHFNHYHYNFDNTQILNNIQNTQKIHSKSGFDRNLNNNLQQNCNSESQKTKNSSITANFYTKTQRDLNRAKSSSSAWNQKNSTRLNTTFTDAYSNLRTAASINYNPILTKATLPLPSCEPKISKSMTLKDKQISANLLRKPALNKYAIKDSFQDDDLSLLDNNDKKLFQRNEFKNNRADFIKQFLKNSKLKEISNQTLDDFKQKDELLSISHKFNMTMNSNEKINMKQTFTNSPNKTLDSLNKTKNLRDDTIIFRNTDVTQIDTLELIKKGRKNQKHTSLNELHIKNKNITMNDLYKCMYDNKDKIRRNLRRVNREVERFKKVKLQNSVTL